MSSIRYKCLTLAFFALSTSALAKGGGETWTADPGTQNDYACHKSLLDLYYQVDDSDTAQSQIPARGRVAVTKSHAIDASAQDKGGGILVEAGRQNGKDGFYIVLENGARKFYAQPDGTPKMQGPQGELYFKVQTPSGPVYFDVFDDHNYGRQVTIARTTHDFPFTPPGIDSAPDLSDNSNAGKKAKAKYAKAMEDSFTTITKAEDAAGTGLTDQLAADYGNLVPSLCAQFDQYDSADKAQADANLAAVVSACSQSTTMSTALKSQLLASGKSKCRAASGGHSGDKANSRTSTVDQDSATPGQGKAPAGSARAGGGQGGSKQGSHPK